MNRPSPGSARPIAGISEEHLGLFFSHTPDILFFKDSLGRWTEANLPALSLFAIEGVDFRGKTNRQLGCWAPFSIEAFEREEKWDETTWQGRKTLRIEGSFALKDGGDVVVDFLKIPLFNEDGTRRCLLTLGRDVTARKRSEREMHRSQERLQYRYRTLVEELESATANLRTLGDHLPDTALYQYMRTGDGNGQYTHVSNGFERILGVSLAELGKEKGQISHLLHPEDLIRAEEAHRQSSENLSVYDFEGRIITPGGEVKWLRWRAMPRKLPAGSILWEGFITNVTKRKMAQMGLGDALHALKVIKECGEAIARAETENELLQDVCNSILRIEGTRMAWIGFPEETESKRILPVVHAGNDQEYVEKLRLTWAETTRGLGPAGTAIRECQVVIFEDLENDPRFEPWREEAFKRGYVSIMALPLVAERSCLGVLSIYFAQPGAITGEKVELFKQLSNDIAHGILTRRSQEERARLEQELLKISEQEKQRMAQELHDGVCQQLAGAAMMGSLLHRKLVQEEHPQADYASEVCKIIAAALTDARDLSHGLHPIKSTAGGLLEALSKLAQNTASLYHTPCGFDYDEDAHVDDPAAVTHLFRIAQEAVTNALKHGNPSRIELALRKIPDGIALTIQDDGVGIQNPASKNGLGLQLMNHRAQTIGATLEILRGEGSGTVVRCCLLKQ